MPKNKLTPQALIKWLLYLYYRYLLRIGIRILSIDLKADLKIFAWRLKEQFTKLLNDWYLAGAANFMRES